MGDTAAAFTLLTTKLHAPAPAANLVARPRLLERLELGACAKLILVSAPAGSGKSTLLGSWLGRRPRAAAWFSVDQGDNDPARFLFYLVSALHRVEPCVGEGSLEALRTEGTDSVEPLVGLINDIGRLDHEVLLVIDDYHLISNRRIHDAVGFLLDHLPPQLRLVIATRSDPPLALSRLRVHGQLVEVRADHLRFSCEEVSEFLNDRLRLDLSSHAVASLEERTEGWVAALKLVALSLEGSSDKEGFVRKFAGSHRYLVDYLVEEVLERQPPEVRRFLQRTSILERFTAPLCRVVSKENDSSALLRYLGDANLFLTALDDEGVWYRYHHLFAEFLRQRLHEAEPEAVTGLHRRAGAWLEGHGWLEEAIHHALAAGDHDHAGKLVEEIAFGLENAFDNRRLVDYVSRFPLDILGHRPKLAIFYGWALANTARADLLSAVLPIIEGSAAHAEDPPLVAACVLALQAFQLLWQMRFRESVRLCREALAVLAHGAHPDSDEARWLLTATHNLIAYCHLHSDVVRADRIYPAVLALSQELGNHIGAANDFARYGWIEHHLGKSQQALAIFREGLRMCESWHAESGRVTNAGELHLTLSRLLYEWNSLDEAASHLQRASEFNKRSQFPPTMALEYDMAFRLHLTLGRTEEAVATLGKLDALLDEVHPDNVLYIQLFGVTAQLLRLRLAASTPAFPHLLEDVRAWVEARRLRPGDTFDYPHEGGYEVLARLLLAQGETTTSLALLERLVRAAGKGGRVRHLIGYLNLRALGEAQLGHEIAALATLERSLALAEPERYVRRYLDEGPRLRVLLERLAARRGTPYVAGLLAATPEALQASGALAVPEPPASPSRTEPPPLLNERERTVLRLLAAGQSNKGIAKELGLSPNTVRWYVSGLLSKLGASSRLEAVSRAKDCGLL